MSASHNTWIHGAVLLGIVLCSGCVTPRSKPRLSSDAQAEALSYFSLGLLAENSGDVEASLWYLQKAIRIDPSEQVLYPSAISAALQLEQPDEALRLAQQLRKHRPDSLPPRLLAAQVCALSGQPEKAEALFREAALNFPEEVDSTTSLARFLIAQNKNEEAIKTLEVARTAHPDHANLLHLLGTLYVDRARDLTAQPDIERAILKGITLLKEALALSPDNPQQWQQLGYACLTVKNPEKAQIAFEKAYELLPGDLQIARQLLDVYILNNSIERALTLCEELPRYTDTDPELWLQYLSEKLPAEHQDKLTAHLETYLKKHPHASVLYYAQLGSIYLDQQKLSDAESVLQNAQKIYPDNDRVRTVIGYLHLQQERYEEAYASFDQVRTNSPDSEWVANPFFTFNFMVAAQKSDHLEEAAETLASSYTKDPVILNRYMQALLTGETPVSTQSAIDLLNRFHTISPEASETLYYLTLLQADQEKYEEALGNARQFEMLASGGANTNLLDGFFYYQYAILHERTGMFDEAEVFFRKAIDIGNPVTVASSQNYIAYMWTERGEKLEMSLELIQQALAAEPDNAAFIDTLGWIYYMQGRYQDALDPLIKASELIRDDPVVWEHLGDTYMKLGDLQTAVQQWKKGLKIDPDHDRLIQRLEENGFSPDKSPAQEDTPSDTPDHP